MKQFWGITAMAAILAAAPRLGAEEMGTAFTYQGSLLQDGAPVTGAYDMQFKLFDAATEGNQVGSTIEATGVSVVNSVFTVSLDFGAGAVNGEARWLETAVTPAGRRDYTTLQPRQRITVVPYALYAAYAAQAPGLSMGATMEGQSAAVGLKIVNDFPAQNGPAVGVQTYVNTPTDNSAGVQGEAKATTGKTYGVKGVTRSSTENAAGVLGLATATSGMTAGVAGQTASSTDKATGVLGLATATSGATAGVSGQTDSSTDDAAGVAGCATATSGMTLGVFGETDSSTDKATGVAGWATATSGATAGVAGQTASSTDDAAGVTGWAKAKSGVTAGVAGQTDSSTDKAAGVTGLATATSGATAGVFGRTQSSTDTAAGVFGWADASSGRTHGVYGQTQSGAKPGDISDGDPAAGVVGRGPWIGVYGQCDKESTSDDIAAGVEGLATTNGSTGVFGWNFTGQNGVGVMGTGDIGVAAKGESVAVKATSTDGNLFEGWSEGARRFVVQNDGRVRAAVFNTFAADFAEMLPGEDGLEPGDVLAVGKDGRVVRATADRAAAVIGVMSTQPGFVGGNGGDRTGSKVPVAVVGVVPVKVTNESGAVRPNDLLAVSPSRPGYAARAVPLFTLENGQAVYGGGTIIGRALEAMTGGEGTVKVLIR